MAPLLLRLGDKRKGHMEILRNSKALTKKMGLSTHHSHTRYFCTASSFSLPPPPPNTPTPPTKRSCRPPSRCDVVGSSRSSVKTLLRPRWPPSPSPLLLPAAAMAMGAPCPDLAQPAPTHRNPKCRPSAVLADCRPASQKIYSKATGF